MEKPKSQELTDFIPFQMRVRAIVCLIFCVLCLIVFVHSSVTFDRALTREQRALDEVEELMKRSSS
jgi:hypothetical protein